jgi:hypothetical protein
MIHGVAEKRHFCLSGLSQSIAMVPYFLSGFELGYSVLRADSMTTAPRRQGPLVSFE